ncbi:YkgJ family cysteine cluster protein [Candidatus Protochlamydia phocaeensis]|uniref:YkgJ family cysteine cluster protein n=1 Tax=Candidatus Protochlamydia phocaeensis TaxID=1414722 RepID=UPI000837AB3E|nr:YkgJ family cysteine cluster protein [Candidatus Protochlamydia phocaeensis]
MTQSHPSFPWYKDGLHFSCTQCGKCCTGSPGFVWVSEQEMAEMAQFLKISIKDFKRLYVRRLHNRYLLVEKKSQNHDCVFYKDRKCQVYQARPSQCRTYPFWKENLLSPQSWEEAAQTCEGICPEAPLISFESIQEQLKQQISDQNEHYVPASPEANYT